MKFEIIESNKIEGAKFELGPKALNIIRISLINSYCTFDEETKEFKLKLMELWGAGRL